MLNHQIYPPPQNFDPSNKEAISEFASLLPVSAFLLMLLGWALSVFLGGVVTGKIARTNWKKLCLITGGILLLASIGNMLLIPQPIWLNGIAILMYLPLAYFGGKLVNSK